MSKKEEIKLEHIILNVSDENQASHSKKSELQQFDIDYNLDNNHASNLTT